MLTTQRHAPSPTAFESCYDDVVKHGDIAAFASRPWAALEEEKRSYWAATKRGMTPLEALAVAEDLREFTQQIRPDFPTARDREADIQMHIRLSEGLRRVAIRRR